MKKVLFALMVALATTLSFTSCSDDDDEIALGDVANSTFTATSSSLSTYNEGKSDALKVSAYTIVFGATDFQLSITQGGNTATASGTFAVASNKVTLTSSDEDYNGYTFTGDGDNKIIDDLFGITLKK